MKPGDVIRLHVPDNQRLDGALAEVLRLTDYGAEVSCSAAGSGRFRALVSEMVPAVAVAHTNGRAKESGYTGDVCDVCGGSRLKRNGACLLCEDCGSSSGCS